MFDLNNKSFFKFELEKISELKMTVQEDNFEEDVPQFLSKRLSTNKSYQILPQADLNQLKHVLF